MDRLTFEGTADTEIRLWALGLSGSVTPVLEIREPDGDLIWDGTCTGGCDFTLVEPGTYLLEISEAGINNTGGYEVTLQCLAGSCGSP